MPTAQGDSASTREQVIYLLRTIGRMTANQIAARLNITAVAVRRHLSTLEHEGMARADLSRQKMGRPTYLYSLTEEAKDLFPTRYELLATQLLDAAQTTLGDNAVPTLFSQRMEQLFRQYQPRMENKNLRERVAELARIQEEAGYMAVWEETDDGYLLKEQNCSIYRIACRFQQACHFEIELFRRLLGADISRVQHQVKGDLCCAYLIREKESSLLAHTARPRKRSANRISRLANE